MDSSITYPYGIPFYADLDFITLYFQNNDTRPFNIHFYEKRKIGNLAGIVFPKEKKKYQFPEGSKVVILTDKGKAHCYIKLQSNWTYIYP